MKKILAFEKENTISFSDRKSLIQFVSEYFTFLYQRELEFGKATAMDDRKEMSEWEERIKREVPELKKMLESILRTKRYYKKKMNLTSKSILFKEAFKAAKIPSHPTGCIPCNVEYKINGLVFSKEVK